MHNSPSRSHDEVLRVARRAVLSGETIPNWCHAALEARGYDVGALEQRIIEMNRYA